MNKWTTLGLVCAAMACGGNEQPVANGTTPAATATATTTTTAQSGPPAQCATLSGRIDAFSADVAKADTQSPAGLQSLGATAMTASKDVGAMQLEGDLGAIARDTSAYMADTSKKVVGARDGPPAHRRRGEQLRRRGNQEVRRRSFAPRRPRMQRQDVG